MKGQFRSSFILVSVFMFVGAWQSAQACPTCKIRFHLKNALRVVRSPNLTQECPGSGHSAPFGNWGVDSDWGQPVDGNQFQGWKKEFSLATLSYNWQWNTCTSNQTEYPVGDCQYYNYDDCTAQLTTEGEDQFSEGTSSKSIFVSCPKERFDGELVGGCSSVQVLNVSTYMSLFEHDPPSTYDFITRIDYGLAQPMLCDPYGCFHNPIYWYYGSADQISAWAGIDIVDGVLVGYCPTGSPPPRPR